MTFFTKHESNLTLEDLNKLSNGDDMAYIAARDLRDNNSKIIALIQGFADGSIARVTDSATDEIVEFRAAVAKAIFAYQKRTMPTYTITYTFSKSQREAMLKVLGALPITSNTLNFYRALSRRLPDPE